MASVMTRTAKQYCCLIAVPIWLIVSLMVIFMPQAFYTDIGSIPESDRTDRQNALVNLQDRYITAGFDRDFSALKGDIKRSKAELKNLKSQKPMWGKAPAGVETRIAMTHERLEKLHHAGKALELERNSALTQIRALTPVFSKMAFEEARELFKERQEEYAGIFCWFWKWDMMWSMLWRMPSGGRDGGLGEMVMRAILDLMYKLTMGTMFALGDFACRLPFWLKEYQIFTFDDLPSEDYLSDSYLSESPQTETSTGTAEKNMGEDYEKDDMYERMQREHYGDESTEEENEINFDEEQQPVQSTRRSQRGKKYEEEFETVGVVGSSGGWSASLYAFVFWCMSICAASGATLGLILLIWSPVIGMLIYAVIKGPRNSGGRGRANYQYHQHYE